MKNVWIKLNLFLVAICCVLLAVMMFTAVIDICARLFFSRPFVGVSELLALMLPVSMLLGLAYVEYTGGHIRVGLIVDKFPSKWQSAMDVMACLFGTFLLGCFTWYGWVFAMESWHTKEIHPGLLDIPTYPTKFLLAIGFTLALIQFFIHLLRGINQIVRFEK